MSDPAPLNLLIQQTYAAAEGTGSWEDFLNTISQHSNSRVAAILRFDISAGATGSITGLDPAQLLRYYDYYSKINPWTARTVNAPLNNTPISPGEALLPLSELRKTEFYNDWGRYNDVVHTLAVRLAIDHRSFVYLSVNRGERHGPIQHHESEFLHQLLPHLSKSITMHEQLVRARALASSRQLLFLLDHRGTVLDMTSHAQRWIANRDLLQIGANRQITTVSLRSQPKFTSLLHGQQPQIIRLLNAKGAEYVLVCRPLPANHHLFSSHFNWSILTVIPPETKSQLTQIGALYSLTPAEIRLCQALLDTGSLDRAMQVLSITRNTVRAQMSSVFRKTNTTRQGELIRLLTRIATIASAPDEP
ncbi:MAG: helix-turn-helix transcriptional regulator [Bryobacteraceae bacterium]